MILPSWFIKVVKPIYKVAQTIPILGPFTSKMAQHILRIKKPKLALFSSSKQSLLNEMEHKLNQYGLIIQGLDQANQGLYQKVIEAEKCNQKSEGLLEKLQEKLHLAEHRIEFVRDECMFELRQVTRALPRTSWGETCDQGQVETKIVDSQALSQSPLKLNLGCGHVPLKGYVNIDSRQLPGVDVVSDVMSVPVEAGEVDEIFASHLIEHFPQRFLQDVLLPYWVSLLKNGGKLHLILPDAEGMFQAHLEGEMTFEELSLVTFGKQDYDGDFHFVMFSPDTIVKLLSQAGFSDINVIEKNRKNGLCREMELVAFSREVK